MLREIGAATFKSARKLEGVECIAG